MSSHCFHRIEPPTALSYFSSAFSLGLSVAITLGNISIILAIVKDPYGKLRTPFAFFLVNAAVSDIAVGVLAMPVSFVLHYMEAERKIGHTSTLLLHITYFISASASLASIAAMAIDRYFTLTSITVRRRVITPRTCIVLSLLIWALAIGFTGFYFVTGFILLLYIYVCSSLIFSFGITLLTYLRVLSQMRRISNCLRQQGRMTVDDKKMNHAILREKKVTNVFISLLIMSIGIYFPVFILTNLLQFCLTCHCNAMHIFRDLVFLLTSTASATNPVICLLKMSIIRKSLFAAVKCRRRNSSVEPSNEAGHSHIA